MVIFKDVFNFHFFIKKDIKIFYLLFEVGSYNETIDAGSFLKTGSRYVYKAEPDDSGIRKMILDLKAKTFFVEAFDADISGTENSVEISIMVGDSFFECASINMKINETE